MSLGSMTDREFQQLLDRLRRQPARCPECEEAPCGDRAWCRRRAEEREQ